MKLIFIRHGDPDYEKDSLTKKGFKEAELLSERVKNWDVSEFFVSPLGRAKDTARVSLEKINRKAKTLEWLREFYAPILDMESKKERIPWDFMPGWWTKEETFYSKEQWINTPIMNTGNVKEEYKRVTKCFDELLKEHGYQRSSGFYQVLSGNQDTLVFFCHLGLQFVLLSHLLGIAAPVLWHGFFVAPTSVTVLCTEERKKGEAYFRCKKLGDTSHLYIAKEKPSDSGFFQEVF